MLISSWDMLSFQLWPPFNHFWCQKPNHVENHWEHRYRQHRLFLFCRIMRFSQFVSQYKPSIRGLCFCMSQVWILIVYDEAMYCRIRRRSALINPMTFSVSLTLKAKYWRILLEIQNCDFLPVFSEQWQDQAVSMETGFLRDVKLTPSWKYWLRLCFNDRIWQLIISC
jgi:hypothetical protein